MNILLSLSAAVLVAAPCAAQQIFPETAALARDLTARSAALGVESVDVDLLKMTAGWPQAKSDARAALDAFNAYVQSSWSNQDAASWSGFRARIWEVAEMGETEQDLLDDRASARIRAEEPDPDVAARRVDAVSTLCAFRKFKIYGNLVPRTIDEGVKDSSGAPIGRRYAGPTWKVSISYEDAAARDAALVVKTGFSAADFEAMTKSVASEYAAAHPLTPAPGQP